MTQNKSLMVRMDAESRSLLTAAADLRRISVSDYVRLVMVEQAKRELESARSQTLALTASEQLEFWNALSQTPKLTNAQKSLSQLMQGKK